MAALISNWMAPEISFHADESVARASRIETLLAQIKDEESSRAANGNDRAAPSDGEDSGGDAPPRTAG